MLGQAAAVVVPQVSVQHRLTTRAQLVRVELELSTRLLELHSVMQPAVEVELTLHMLQVQVVARAAIATALQHQMVVREPIHLPRPQVQHRTPVQVEVDQVGPPELI
jgi:hypothetical protein